MSLQLTLSTLGDLVVQLDGQEITDFPTRKVKALLVYLAVERASLHRRESLFTLLWPGMPEKTARNNLRQVLYFLRKTIPEVDSSLDDAALPLLLSDRELEILKMLAEGQSNPENATNLYLSLNTVKAHTRSIYGKLGVYNCTQAGAKARSLGLL